MVMTFTGFTGYAILLPVAPLWAVHGGAGTAGSGLVNFVLLLATVLTQLFVPRSLRRWGWGPVMALGMLLLGVPAAAYAASDGLGWVLACSAVRGMGFGVLTVVGASAVAALVDPRRRGEAIGAYGLAVALPNVVLLPIGPWLAEEVSFWAVFLVAALPLLGIPASLRVASTLHERAPDLLEALDPGDSPTAFAHHLPLLRPMVLLLSVTLAGGAVITFAPQMVDHRGWVTAGLFVMGLLTTLTRWRIGAIADRLGAQRFLVPLVLLTVVGTGLTAWSVAGDDTRIAVFLVGMVALGLAYGGLQNLTLLLCFAAVSRRQHNDASAGWNIAFDVGTALGSVAVGAIAAGTSFASAFLVVTAVVVLVLPLAALDPSRRTPGPTAG